MGREGTEGSDFHCARTGGRLEFSYKDAVQVHAAQCPRASACQKKAEEQKDGQHFQRQTCNRSPPAIPWMWVAKSRGLQERIPVDVHAARAEVPLWARHPRLPQLRGALLHPREAQRGLTKSCTADKHSDIWGSQIFSFCKQFLLQWGLFVHASYLFWLPA